MEVGKPVEGEAATAIPESRTPADFLKSIRGQSVVVKLNSGVDYRGAQPLPPNPKGTLNPNRVSTSYTQPYPPAAPSLGCRV